MKSILSCLVLLSASLNAQTPFSADSAFSYLKTFSVDIGPRPMGSPSLQRAMEFGLAKFRSFGLSQAYFMPMRSVPADGRTRATITTSGVAVGILKGKSDKLIVIGGHMDSASPDIPGTNDDGSGASVVLELARVLAQRQNEHTLVFCLFDGEEQGLRGSQFFVENFAQLAQVELMIQVDMANGSDWLMPLTDTYTHSSPEWLVKASYEEFKKLGYQGLSYPTHFLTLNNSIPGGAIGSDHEPFLEKGIPAIDFTSDVNDPIHTPQDNFENFIPSGLKRTGDLVYALLQRFDDGMPAEKSGNYYLLQVGGEPYFFSPLLVRAFVAVAILCAVIALFLARKERTEVEKALRPRIPGLKMFLLMLSIQVCVWLSENVVGLLKGQRLPWFNDIQGYFILGFVAACIGIWIALQLAKPLNLSRDPYRWLLRSVTYLLILTFLTALASRNLALYPATALLLISCASLVRLPSIKLLLWILSPYSMYRLIFSEGFDLFARAGAAGIPPGLMTSILTHALYIVFFSLWAFPFLLAFASIYHSSKTDLLWLLRYKGKWGIVGSGSAFALCAIILSFRPTYDSTWSQIIRIDENGDVSKGTVTLSARSTDYLVGSKVQIGNKDTTLMGRNCDASLGTVALDTTKPWISFERNITSVSDSVTTFDMQAKIRTRFRPYTLLISYSTSKGKLKDVVSLLPSNVLDRSVTFWWYSFPDSAIYLPFHCVVSGTDSLTETVEATFTQQLVPVRIAKDHATTISRTILRQSTILHHDPQ
jgi:hypothetical protein